MTPSLYEPIEITEIQNGVIFFYQGGLMNAGMKTWYAFDADKNLFIAVLMNPKRPANPEKINQQQIVRLNVLNCPEFVTTLAANAEQAENYKALVTQLLQVTEQTIKILPLPEDSLVQAFHLRQHGQWLDIAASTKALEIQNELKNFVTFAVQELIFQAL